MISIRLDQARNTPRFAGLLGLYSLPVRSRNDFICSPDMDSFSIEQAKCIAGQIRLGKRSGVVDDLRWEVRESIKK